MPVSAANSQVVFDALKASGVRLCNLERRPATGAVVIAVPLKIVGGSGSPVRAIALVAS